MDTKFTRGQFLTAVSAGATYLAMSHTVGCDLRERTPKAKTLKGRPLSTPKVWPLKKVSSTPSKGVWAFRSRPDLIPPAVEVTTQAHGTAPGYIFIAPRFGPGQHGPMIIDNLGQPVWFRKGKYAQDFKVQHYRGKPVLTCWEGELFPRPRSEERRVGKECRS